MKRKTIIIWGSIVAAAALATAISMIRVRHLRARSSVIQGAIIRDDSDSRKEMPIAGVAVTASNGTATVSTQSDASGYFRLSYPQILWPGRNVDLRFRKDGYLPLDMSLRSGLHLTNRDLYIARMSTMPQPQPEAPVGKLSVVSNIKVRYTVNSESANNIGSAVKTFEVANHGSAPCNHASLCSPDGNWKAARGSISLDAGPSNEFRDVRASCIAGPCPFTRVESGGFARGGRTITVSAIDWSDTATFLVEAEVFHDSINSFVRELYPVIFGDALHFTLPPTQEGVSLEAELNGSPMVFPLGPDLYLSWATCTQRTDDDKTSVFRCELKPGYRF